MISRQELIAIDILHGALGARARHIVAVVNDVLTAATLAVIGRDGVQLIALLGPKTAPATGIIYRWFYLSLLTFCCLGIFFIVERLALGERLEQKDVLATLATAEETLK